MTEQNKSSKLSELKKNTLIIGIATFGSKAISLYPCSIVFILPDNSGIWYYGLGDNNGFVVAANPYGGCL